MEGRRIRNSRHDNRNLLPLRRSSPSPRRLSNTISCSYCDYKITAFNEPLLRFGRRYSTALRLWFSVGVGFTLTALFCVILFLVWEFATAIHLIPANPAFENLSGALLFGFDTSLYGSEFSLSNAAYLLVSTLISVFVHEFGHAVAAASEGVRVEYIAAFIALLFPGALVAFNYELLELVPRFSALRIYCAGIWHNAVLCAACGVALFLLPFFLFPFYRYGESPTVVEIPPSSPLFGYLSPGDVIESMDGRRVHNLQIWRQIAAIKHKQIFQNPNNSQNTKSFGVVDDRMGYCVPYSMVEGKPVVDLIDDQSTCPNDLTPFVTIHGYDLRTIDSVHGEYGYLSGSGSGLCLNASDVAKSNKCRDGQTTTLTNITSFACSREETCVSPVQFPGSMWAEITYLSPQSSGCLKYGGSPNSDSYTNNTTQKHCGGSSSFVFVGDIDSMANSIHLTEYRSRWAFPLDTYIPNAVEKCLKYVFHVSLTLALLNSLPVYFLDGESVLETALWHYTSIGQRKRRKVVQVCLLVGSLFTTLAFARLFLSFCKSLYS